MEDKVRFNVIAAVSTVAKKLEGSALHIRRTKEFSAAVERLCTYFGTNEQQTWMLCSFISWYFDHGGDSCNFNNLSDFFECNVMSVIVYKADIEVLLEKGYIFNAESVTGKEIGLQNEFVIAEELLEAVLQNRKVVITRDTAKKDILSMIQLVGNAVDGRRHWEGSSYGLFRDVEKIEASYADFDFVKDAKLLLEDIGTRIFFYDACFDFINGDETGLNITLLDIYSDSEKYAVAREFLEEKHILLQEELVEFTKKENLSEAELTISQKAKEMLLGERAALYDKSVKGTDILEPESIKEKRLFYSEENAREIKRLETALEEGQLKKIRERLSSKGMPCGIAVLLYGAPGTGKTETVYQLARLTGRKLYHVDISNTKSCWFGESEKMIKKVFSNYRQMCTVSGREKGGKAPILLFNEADAVFSKRKDASSSNVAQTENAIQNIILEEVERLDGILIATTNLVDNLDTAFERRFLFKIKFENPSLESRKKIWQSKLDWLDDAAAESLSRRYDFSGGQIDNVARKVTMDEVITGKLPSLDELDALCKAERLAKNDDKKIGFF